MADSKKKIFLIEDELDILYIHKMALLGAGFNVLGLSTGREVMERIKRIQTKKEEKPDLILLDLVLPDINGLEILREIRENKITKDIKVFILSNYTSEALLNIKYIKPDKFIIKSATRPLELVRMVHEATGG